jgi:16S rRNA (guanine527-N7)-methyltransferase
MVLATMGLSEVHCMQTIRGPEEFAATFGAPRETVERLVLYERLLRQWQKAVNLVAPRTLDSIWHRHFADSAQLAPLAPPGTRSWIDLGSGAGFPGLVVAIMLAPPSPRPSPASPQTASGRGEGWGEGQEQAPTPLDGVRPLASDLRNFQSRGGEGSDPARPLPASGERGSIRFTLIESDARKCAFLREVARQTEIMAGNTVDILSKRAESVTTSVNEDLPRVVSARALAPLDRLLDLAAPLSPPGTTLLFLKGREVAAELQLAESRWQFQVALVQSVTDTNGRVPVITNLERKAKD